MNTKGTFSDCCIESLADSLRPDLFKAMCDPVRISIVATLASRIKPSTVSDIAQCCDIDFSGVSRHLKILKDAGIVSTEKQGRKALYSLEAETLAATLRSMADALDICQKEAA